MYETVDTATASGWCLQRTGNGSEKILNITAKLLFEEQ